MGMKAAAARRHVGVHLTPFAPGIRSLPLGHPRRWATLWSRTPRGAVAATLNRLGLSPQAVAVAPEAGVQTTSEVLSEPASRRSAKVSAAAAASAAC